MTQASLFAPPTYDVQPGDIYQLGRHRLICADATDKAEVARLFAGNKPTMVVTSPPYAKQRDYDRPIACWDSMMLGALDGHAFSDDMQMLVNLGVVHRSGEWWPYWQTWVDQMRKRGWRHFGMYCWDKLSGYPGRFPGRMTPSFEFIFHMNKVTGVINKIMPCTCGRTSMNVSGVRNKTGRKDTRKPSIINTHKPSDSVIRIKSVHFGEHTGHPAQMPLALSQHLISSFKTGNTVTYDPFLGSGTTILAAEAEDITGLGCEISPAYVAIALARWNKAYPHMPARKLEPAT